ncbi:VIT domain-containing protein [Verrucomicrobiaceae bacterium 227]
MGEVFAGVSLKVGGKDAEFSEALIDCQLQGRFLVRNLELAFYHEGAGQSEGELICPLDEGERIVSFAMDVNGKRRSAVVVPAKRGRIAYEEIVARKVDPGLLEVDEVKNEFRTRVFPIPAKGEKRVWITTVQLVDAGEVVVWPGGFGAPKRWELVLESLGGTVVNEGGALQWKSGVRSALPGNTVTWKPEEDLVYEGGPEPVRFSKFTDPEYKAKRIEVWLDGTVEVSEVALGNLRELLEKYGQAELGFRVFREELSEVREWTLRDGGCPEIFEEMGKEMPHGMARPQVLPFESVEADVVILVTDGEFVGGPEAVGKPACVLHVIDSGEGKSEWMRGKAKLSGGGWHGSEGLDETGKLRNLEALAVGELEGEVLEFGGEAKEGEKVIQSSIAKWLWAFLESRRMEDEGMAKEEVDRFRAEHGVWEPGASLLVLETAGQYFQYGFDPPRDDVELMAAYDFLKRRREVHERKLEDQSFLIAAWKKRCDLLESPLDPVNVRLLAQMRKGKAFWRGIETRFDEVTPEMVKPYFEGVEAGRELLKGGIKKDEVEGMKEVLGELRELERKLRTKVPRFFVMIGGQVKRPGKVELKGGATLYQAVEAAGGAPPFGAMNRVKLYRNGTVYTYDLRRDAHKSVQLYEGDMVEVPQKIWMGNGGSQGREKAPFTSEGASFIKVRTGKWNSSAAYLKDLEAAITGEDEFWNDYQGLREIYGWRPDFYLDVIEWLEKRARVEDAMRVAGDLAELMPENAEVLGKAARAFRRLGQKELALELFERVVVLEPEGVTHRYELARTYAEVGKNETAVEIYVSELKEARRPMVRFANARLMVILEELNALMARTGVKPADDDFPQELIRHVPVELRAVLEWDADQANVDIVGRDPMWANGFMDEAHNFHSGNVTDGYGPEASSMVGLLPGMYSWSARFYGDWKDNQSSTVTAEVEIVRNFGEKNEQRERHAVRLREKEEKTLVEVDVWPQEWE